jgi:hypothetical protein
MLRHSFLGRLHLPVGFRIEIDSGCLVFFGVSNRGHGTGGIPR